MSALPTLMWLPGHMCDARLWRDVKITSQWPNVHPELKDRDTIEALARHALDQAEGPIIPIGFSMGAIVALMMARMAPQRLAGLVLTSTNCTADLPERSAARLTQQASVRDGHLDIVVRDELKPHYLSPSTQGTRRHEILDVTFAMGMDLGAHVFLRKSEALRTRPALCEVIDTLTCPILIIAGEHDTLCPPQWHEAMAARGRHVQLQPIPDAGHLVPLEAPALFSTTLENWLNKINVSEESNPI